MTAEKKIESLIYDLETSIEACEKIEKESRDKGNYVLANTAYIRGNVYKEILNKIK